MNGRIVGVVLAASVAILVMAPGSAFGSGWRLVGSTNAPARAGSLAGVSCRSASLCFAVGQFLSTGGAYRTLAQRWNGSRWRLSATVDPAGFKWAGLVGVSCWVADGCIAVGHWVDAAGGQLPLAERWNGSAWSLLSVPLPSGAGGGRFTGVSCAPAGVCRAVGDYGSGGFRLPLAERWDGGSWVVQSPVKQSTSTWFTAVSCPSAGVCEAVGASSGGGLAQQLVAERWTPAAGWVVQAPAQPSGASAPAFSGISCVSASACQAVGTNGSTGSSLTAVVEGWNGSSWTAESPGGPDYSPLQAVSCTAANACVAVGPDGNTADFAYSEAWNGSTWSSPAVSGYGALDAVSCTSANACIGVGYNEFTFTGIDAQRVPIALSWNATDWSQQTAAAPTGAAPDDLAAVSCPSSSACEAVGQYVEQPAGDELALAIGWNGTRWSYQPTPDPSGANFAALDAVSCTAANACTAVGYSVIPGSPTSEPPLAERWNGSTWTIQPVPVPAGEGATLTGVSCVSASFCVAVGYSFASSGPFLTLAEVWDGDNWTITPTPSPGNSTNVLSSVSCTAPDACTAVGFSRDNPWSTLAERWNGSSWTGQSTPNPSGASEPLLTAVSCTSASACTAVGGYDPASVNEFDPFAEQWDGTTWTIQSMPPTGTNTNLSSLSCNSASACTTVGWVGGNGRSAAIAYRLDASGWNIQRLAGPYNASSTVLSGVVCETATACTAVGYYTNGFGIGAPELTLTETWSG